MYRSILQELQLARSVSSPDAALPGESLQFKQIPFTFVNFFTLGLGDDQVIGCLPLYPDPELSGPMMPEIWIGTYQEPVYRRVFFFIHFCPIGINKTYVGRY